MTYRFESLPLVKEGKTKIIRRAGNGFVHIKEKNDMTAGNGKRHALVAGKGKICAAVTARLFWFLEQYHIPHTLDAEVAPGINSMREVRMLPFEVVGRFKAAGSYCKRYPEVPPGTLFDELQIEFYLKTKDKVFAGIELPDDDPLIIRRDSTGIDVVHPALRHGSDEQRASLVRVPGHIIDTMSGPHEFEDMRRLARDVGFGLLMGWASVGCDLIDFKVEFGVDEKRKNQLVLADSLSPDEMRVEAPDGRLICKEPFRQGASVDEMVELYTEALAHVLQM